MTTTPHRRAGGPGRPATHPAPVVRAHDLTFSYGEYHAVRGVSLEVAPGEVFALLGTNGAGKTTTLEILQGYRRRSRGELEVLGVDPAREPEEVRRRSGVMLQDAGLLPELSVAATVELWRSLSSREDDVDAVLERVGLTHRRRTGVQALSGGERRRLDLALAIWGSPDLVILDEPTTGLDPASRRTLWDQVEGLRDAGATVLLTTHHLEEAEALADHVAIMHEGRIAVAGTLDEVLHARPASVSADVHEPAVAAGLAAAAAARGLVLHHEPVRRPVGPRTALRLECHDLPNDLLWFLQETTLRGVALERLRATPASLEDVFHAVRDGELGGHDGHDHAGGDDGRTTGEPTGSAAPTPGGRA